MAIVDLAKRAPPQQTGMPRESGEDTAPHVIDGCDTLAKLFLERCRSLGPRTAHREKTLGVWQSHSWSDFLEAARAIGLGLSALGLERGEVVSILSEDNKEWVYADLGIQCMGGIVSGVYPTDSADQLAFLLGNSESRFLIAGNAELLEKFLQIRDRVPGVRKCILIDREGLHDFADEQILFLDDLYEIGIEVHRRDPGRFEREARASRPGDTAVLIYTSGTTGRPKGAMISHENIVCSASTVLGAVPTREGDEQLCFLPLCHVLERLISVFVPIAAKTVVNFAESVETVFDNLREVSPTSFTAVPRIWEKIHSRVTVMAGEATPAGRWAWRLALACGIERAGYRLEGRPVPALLEARFRLWDRLVLANLRRMTGLDGARYIASGAAPISPELVKWYWAIGLVMLEGYGQTESTGVLSVNLPGRNRLGSIGRAVPGVEMKIGADGEILARGPLVFKGYWKAPALTAETVRDGWLHTGDVGRLDDDGFFWITGRIKDIIITAGGKNVSPAAIENRLKFSPHVSDAMVVGDRRRYLTALIVINPENVERFAQENGVPFSDFASLCAAAPVLELIRAEVEAVNANMAPVEQIKDFRLIDILLTAEDDEMTPTMKLRRGLVEQKHSALIEQMY